MHVLALGSEVTKDRPIKAVWGSDDYALFRDQQGECHVLADMCAHRRAPLSQGKITPEGLIECPYHGWRYDGATGACLKIPNLADTSPPPAYRVRAFTAIEQDGFVWAQLSADDELPEISPLAGLAGEIDAEGSHLFACPAAVFLEALTAVPGACLTIPGIEIIDDHGLGDPQIVEGIWCADFAARPKRRRNPGSAEVSDFRYSLRLQTEGSIARVRLYEKFACIGELVCAIVPHGANLTRLIWRQCNVAQPQQSHAIRPRRYLDPAPLAASPRFSNNGLSNGSFSQIFESPVYA